MSDSMTTVEIEDVLSSIRRLVSEDLRPTHKLVSAALRNNANKLILTPALRIVSDVRDALPEPEFAAGSQEDLQSVLLEIDVVDHLGSMEKTAVFGSIRSTAQSNFAGAQTNFDDDFPSADANFLATAMSRINGLAELDSPARASDTIETVVATVGAAVGPDEWEIDGGDPAPHTSAWSDAAWSADPDHESSPADTHEEHLQTKSEFASTAVSPEAESGNLVASRETSDELDKDADLDPSDCDTHHMHLQNDSIIFRDAMESNGAASGDDAIDDLDDEDESTALLNEDVLREIVRDMIREELQGSLGERITRNVRKLVRAEINRALASGEFKNIASRS